MSDTTRSMVKDIQALLPSVLEVDRDELIDTLGVLAVLTLIASDKEFQSNDMEELIAHTIKRLMFTDDTREMSKVYGCALMRAQEHIDEIKANQGEKEMSCKD